MGRIIVPAHHGPLLPALPDNPDMAPQILPEPAQLIDLPDVDWGKVALVTGGFVLGAGLLFLGLRRFPPSPGPIVGGVASVGAALAYWKWGPGITTDTSSIKILDEDGNALEGDEADQAITFTGVANGVNSQVVNSGGTIDIDNGTTDISWVVSFPVQNLDEEEKFLTFVFEVTERLGLTEDITWVRFDPGRGVIANHPDSQGVGTNFGGTPVSLSPGEVATVVIAFTVDGPAASAAAKDFWAKTDTNQYNLRVTPIETVGPSAETGTEIADRQIDFVLTTVASITAGDLTAENISNPVFISEGGSNPDVAQPGETLRLEVSDWLRTVQTIRVTNQGTTRKWINALINLTDITVSPDRPWVVFEPGFGFLFNYPGSQGVEVFSQPVLDGIPVDPGQTIEDFFGLFVEGPANPDLAEFWADHVLHQLRYSIKIMEMSAPGDNTGIVLFEQEYLPVELDIVIPL